MADRRPADKKPKGSGNPNRINRLLVKKAGVDFSKLTNMVVLQNLAVNSEQNLDIRSTLRERKSKLRVVRNRLTVKALLDLGFKEAQKLFVGASCVIDADDPVTAAKVAVELVEKYAKALKLTGGVLEGKLLTADEIKSLAKSKTKPEMIGDIVGMTRGPGSRIAGALKGPGAKIAGALKMIVEKLEKGEAIAAKA